MTPQTIIKAKLLELAGAAEVKITVRNQKGAFYALMADDDYERSRQLLHRLLPESYMTSCSPFELTFRLGPDRAIADALRDTEIDPAWLAWNDSAVLRVAQGIHDDHHFKHLPILADALEEAGCTSAALLTHCRSALPHGRSCWVVDLVLGSGKKPRRGRRG